MDSAAAMPHTTPHVSLLLCCWLAGLCILPAREHTVTSQPFSVDRTLTATVLPLSPVQPLPEPPKRWNDFTIRRLAAHGSKVTRGQCLLEFDASALDRKLDDMRRSITTKALALEQAEQDLAHLIATREIRLEAFRTTARVAREDHDHFVNIQRDAEARKADHQRERARQYLDNQTEELRQLQAMYAADDLTEDTEEIILTRQKDQVASARFALEMQTLDQKRAREVLLPREAVEHSDRERDASISLKQAEQSIPRAIELKRTEVETLQSDLSRERESLAELEHDRSRMNLVAPSDGWFHHGLIENGRWITGDLVKPLVQGGRPAMNRAFATFIPADSMFGLVAQADGTTTRSLSRETKASACFPGREDVTIALRLEPPTGIPAPDGMYSVVFHADWPKDAPAAVGSVAEVRCIAYHRDKALVVPSAALSYGTDGWHSWVKRADGKTERRPVRRGRVSAGSVEILGGLEPGQVVILAETP